MDHKWTRWKRPLVQTDTQSICGLTSNVMKLEIVDGDSLCRGERLCGENIKHVVEILQACIGGVDDACFGIQRVEKLRVVDKPKEDSLYQMR
jgi:hypothetical protein